MGTPIRDYKGEITKGPELRIPRGIQRGDSNQGPQSGTPRKTTIIWHPIRDPNWGPCWGTQAMDSNQSGTREPSQVLAIPKLLRTTKCPKLGSKLGLDIPKGDPKRSHVGWMDRREGMVGYLTSHEAYRLCVGNHSGHNLHTQGWEDMKMKGQPNCRSHAETPRGLQGGPRTRNPILGPSHAP